MNIAFVILHYQTIDITLDCVSSIYKNIDKNQFKVVIVDNGSPNRSGQILIEHYKEDKNVVVLQSEQNLGFARGLNTGISFAKNNFQCDFIVLLNNDTEIISSNWVEVINEKFIQYNFHVLGPDIVSIDGKHHANPMKHKIKGVKDLIRIIFIQLKDLFKCYFYIDFLLKRLLSNRQKKVKDNKAGNKDLLNVQLQGSCFILSKSYFNNYEGLYNKTFLYFEEDILKYIADRDNLLLMYTPEITLLHKEGISTMAYNKTRRRKDIFSIKHSLKSSLVFLKLMLKDRQPSRSI
ncbi:glycosyltransferase [Robertmurraya korlensis]|uniref:glycosyltransferase family 2 protein n=1 Tax=Robertmurraya korlensis TaxID=519977 RepID=UPI00203EB234|nr:glycosyltransferase [Robertmurraya korlensis]MCM3602200.1 glycosyltransferase [Robertmurraya korlensis]